MSTLFIGGDSSTGQNSIVLTRCQVLNWNREPVFHGPDYIYTAHRLRVRAVLNPGVNAWTLSPQFTNYAAPMQILQGMGYNVSIVQRDTGPVTTVVRTMGNNNQPGATLPYESAGTVAPITDVAIRHWIERPRQQVVLITGGVPVLVSPNLIDSNSVTRPGTDVKGGPFLTANDVVYISGGKSFIVDLSIETFVNEAGIYQATPSVLLSHRWEPSEDLDQDYFGTRTIRGTAHFRLDRLNFLGAVADEFRSYLVHPLPFAGWKRVAAHFQVSDDGSRVDYALVDKELAMSIIPPGVTRIEAFQTVDANSGDAFGAAAGQVGNVFDVIAGALRGPLGWGDVANALKNVGVNVGKNILLPKTTTIIAARVWGRSDVGRKTLENTALAIVTNRLDRCIQQFGLFGAAVQAVGVTNMKLTHDLAGKFVDCVCVRDFPIPPNGIKAALALVPDVASFFPDDDETTNVLTIFHGNVTPMGLPNYKNSQGIGSRGTTLIKLAVASLLGPDATPAIVTINGIPQNLTPP